MSNQTMDHDAAEFDDCMAAEYGELPSVNDLDVAAAAAAAALEILAPPADSDDEDEEASEDEDGSSGSEEDESCDDADEDIDMQHQEHTGFDEQRAHEGSKVLRLVLEIDEGEGSVAVQLQVCSATDVATVQQPAACLPVDGDARVSSAESASESSSDTESDIEEMDIDQVRLHIICE